MVGKGVEARAWSSVVTSSGRNESVGASHVDELLLGEDEVAREDRGVAVISSKTALEDLGRLSLDILKEASRECGGNACQGNEPGRRSELHNAKYQ